MGGRTLVGAGLAVAISGLPLPGGRARWERTNFRGRPVSLASGPALALAAVAGADLPVASTVVAGLVCGALGGYDDRAGSDTAKGFRGHLGALRRGRLTSGGVKLIGTCFAGPVAVALLPRRSTFDLLPRRRVADLLLGGGVIAGSANLLNLLDLRPGRALKVGLLTALALRQPGPAAAAAALLPGDLAERMMLGDAGANALGAVLGLAVVHRARSRRSLSAVLAGLIALTAASEVVSFSVVIDAVPPLRTVDRLGRRQ